MRRSNVGAGVVDHGLTPPRPIPAATMMQGYVSSSSVALQPPCLNGVGPSTTKPGNAQCLLGRDGARCIEELELAVDTRKRELLEARLVNEKGVSHEAYSNSNLSKLSGVAQNEEAVQMPGVLETVKTPSSSGKKRKRKCAADASFNGIEGSSQHDTNCKKISDYLKQCSSAARSLSYPTSGISFSQIDVCDPVSMAGGQQKTAASLQNVQVQTDMTFSEIENLEGRSAPDMSRKDAAISNLELEREELHKQLATQQKSIDKNKDVVQKCKNVTKTLLIEKSNLEKKTARQKCMENRLRLGQFVTQRQGATFVENWVDGFAFNDLTKKQERVAQEREDIEKQRKLLGKRKPSAIASSNKSQKPVKENDGFLKPSDKPLTVCEFYEQDEILKLRAAALKKEDSDLQMEMEKLEQERNLHVRELRRIHGEDTSRFNQHQVLNERYLLLNLLGKGGFSEIHKGFDLIEQRYVACKLHQQHRDWKEEKKINYIKHAIREYNVQKLLDHPRIIRLYDVFEIDNNSFCTVLEYCDGSDLEFYLKQNKVISEKETRSIIVQMVSALKYLNEIKPPVIHYDLKPGNVLLSKGSSTGEIKITDFGLCKVMNRDECGLGSELDLASQSSGSYWYLPPECFMVGKDSPKISSKVDVWSLGVIFYQCVYGKKPFGNDLSQAAILEENTILKATEVQFPCKPPISNEAKVFIRRCLAHSRDLRPDVLTLAQDDYLRPPVMKSKKPMDDATIQLST